MNATLLFSSFLGSRNLCDPTFFPYFFFGNHVYFIFKSVAYNQDVLIIRKLSLWVCLKTRCATKRDALVLATLRYVVLEIKN